MRRPLLVLLAGLAAALLFLVLLEANADRSEPWDTEPAPEVGADDGLLRAAPSGAGTTATSDAAATDAEGESARRGRSMAAAGAGEPPPGPSTRNGEPGAASASISGRAHVPHDLSTRARDMRMYVTRTEELGPNTSSETWIQTGVLDARGDYKLPKLRPGRYFLQLVLDGRAVSEPHRLELGTAEQVEGRDFDFERVPAAEGRVFSATDTEPLVGARVELEGEPPEQTDADGRFTLYDLRTGHYALLVRHPEHAPGRLSFQVKAQGPKPRLEFALQAGAEARITAVGPDGKVVPRLFVTLCARDHVATAYTDDRGEAFFRGLEPHARYTIRLPGAGAGDPPVMLVPEAESVREVRLTWEP